MRNVSLIRNSIELITEEQTMRTAFGIRTIVILLVALSAGSAWADDYSETIDVFKKAIPSSFFEKSYGYAVFPTIGKGGAGIGGAHGKGRVYARGVHVGDTSMSQLTVGFQLGGQAFSQIIFFEDERAFNQFASGNFEFGAQATAVAITAGASATATTTGNSAGASGGRNDAKSFGEYYRGMAIFTVAKGGLMYEASVGGQKFNYKKVKSAD
jgi:lipid-binding SYLF domain-containing protein